MLVNDDALALSDVDLTLGWNLDEGARAGLALDGHHSQTVLRGATDAAVRAHKAIVDALGRLVTVRLEQLLLRLGLGNNRLQFRFLRVEVILALVETLARAVKPFSLLLRLSLTLADALLAKLNLERLVLNLLGERFKLAIIAHVVLLLGVLLDQRVELEAVDRLLLQERVDRRVEERPVLRERLLARRVGLVD